MRKLLLLVALVAATTATALVDARQTESAGFLCAIKNPPAKVTWSGNRLFARIETKCIRRVAVLTGVACLQRFGSMNDPTPVTPNPREPLDPRDPMPPITQCRASYAYGDNSLVVTVSHECEYTRYTYFWRVQGWTSVSDAQIKTTVRSPVVNSPRIMATCQ